MNTGERSDDKIKFKQLVDRATTPLLMIHGIIGNTKEMAEVGQQIYHAKKCHSSETIVKCLLFLSEQGREQ